MRYAIAALSLLTLGCSSAPLGAQSVTPAEGAGSAGSHARVSVASARTGVAPVAQSLLPAYTAATAESGGESTGHRGRHAAIGAAIGAAVGAGVGALAASQTNGAHVGLTPAEAGALLGGLVGLAAGAAIGALFR